MMLAALYLGAPTAGPQNFGSMRNGLSMVGTGRTMQLVPIASCAAATLMVPNALGCSPNGSCTHLKSCAISTLILTQNGGSRLSLMQPLLHLPLSPRPAVVLGSKVRHSGPSIAICLYKALPGHCDAAKCLRKALPGHCDAAKCLRKASPSHCNAAKCLRKASPSHCNAAKPSQGPRAPTGVLPMQIYGSVAHAGGSLSSWQTPSY